MAIILYQVLCVGNLLQGMATRCIQLLLFNPAALFVAACESAKSGVVSASDSVWLFCYAVCKHSTAGTRELIVDNYVYRVTH